jgi:hypothetical protein
VVSDGQFANKTGHGLLVGDLSLVRDCTAMGNGGDGLVLDGLGGTLTGCSAGGNTLSGLRVGRGTLVRDCTAWGNDRAGLVIADVCSVTGCLLTDNGTVGIAVLGEQSRVEGNHAAGNAIGIEVAGRGNVLVRNTLAANAKALMAVPGNTVGGLYEAPPVDLIGAPRAPKPGEDGEEPGLSPWGNVVH